MPFPVIAFHRATLWAFQLMASLLDVCNHHCSVAINAFGHGTWYESSCLRTMMLGVGCHSRRDDQDVVFRHGVNLACLPSWLRVCIQSSPSSQSQVRIQSSIRSRSPFQVALRAGRIRNGSGGEKSSAPAAHIEGARLRLTLAPNRQYHPLLLLPVPSGVICLCP